MPHIFFILCSGFVDDDKMKTFLTHRSQSIMVCCGTASFMYRLYSRQSSQGCMVISKLTPHRILGVIPWCTNPSEQSTLVKYRSIYRWRSKYFVLKRVISMSRLDRTCHNKRLDMWGIPCGKDAQVMMRQVTNNT